MILHQVEALAAAGVTDIVLAVNYRPEIMTAALKKYEEKYNVKITFSVETEPLGTAGPLKLAEKILAKDDQPFFVLNSDVICEYPFQQLADFHKSHGNEGTIVVTKVEEPSKYGVIVHKPDHPSRIDRFVEKPVEFVGNRINAGIYILNPSILSRIELRPTSIEQETFPACVKDGQLHSFDLEGFWMDVGQPKDFLAGTCLYLSSLAKNNSKLLVSNSEPYVYGGNVMVDPSAKIGKNCRIGPNVTIGPNVVIGDGVRIQRSVILENSKVKDHAWVKSTICGWNSSIGKWARLENVTVLGDDVSIGDEVYVNGGSVLPHKSIKQNVEGMSFFLSFLSTFFIRQRSGKPFFGDLNTNISLFLSPIDHHVNEISFTKDQLEIPAYSAFYEIPTSISSFLAPTFNNELQTLPFQRIQSSPFNRYQFVHFLVSRHETDCESTLSTKTSSFDICTASRYASLSKIIMLPSSLQLLIQLFN